MTDIALPPPAVATRLQWGKAFANLRRLLQDKDDTVAVFEIMRALNGRSTAKGYDKLLRSAEGGRLAYERAELAERLRNGAWLAAQPSDSVAAAYLGFLTRNGFTPDGLIETSQVGAKPFEQRHPYAWFGRRTRDMHDLWHVLNGYETDGLGEACLVAFSYAQTRGLGWALIGFGAWQSAMRLGARAHAKAILEGYRRGKRAAWLQGQDWEKILSEPLELARRRLGIEPPQAYLAIPPERRDRGDGRV